MRTTIGVAVIQNQKILLVKKKDNWILPGGKPEQGESELETLARELSEELPQAKISDFRFYNSFQGISPNSRLPTEAKVYFGELEGEVGSPKAEILDAQFSPYPGEYKIGELMKKILDSLKQDEHL